MVEYRGDGKGSLIKEIRKANQDQHQGSVRHTPTANEPVVKRDYGDSFLNLEPKETARQEVTYRSWKLKRLDPFFLWYVYMPDGKPYSGGFTSLELAARQIDFYIADNDKKRREQEELLRHETKETD